MSGARSTTPGEGRQEGSVRGPRGNGGVKICVHLAEAPGCRNRLGAGILRRHGARLAPSDGHFLQHATVACRRGKSGPDHGLRSGSHRAIPARRTHPGKAFGTLRHPTLSPPVPPPGSDVPPGHPGRPPAPPPCRSSSPAAARRRKAAREPAATPSRSRLDRLTPGSAAASIRHPAGHPDRPSHRAVRRRPTPARLARPLRTGGFSLRAGSPKTHCLNFKYKSDT